MGQKIKKISARGIRKIIHNLDVLDDTERLKKLRGLKRKYKKIMSIKATAILKKHTAVTELALLNLKVPDQYPKEL